MLTLNEKGDKVKMTRVASPESLLIYLKMMNRTEQNFIDVAQEHTYKKHCNDVHGGLCSACASKYTWDHENKFQF